MATATPQPATPTTDWMTAGWQFLVVRGVLAVLFGIVAAAWPISTAVALVVLWGVWAAVDGVSSLATALRRGTHPWARLGHGLMGLVGLAVAFLAIVRPGLTAVTLTWVLGIWLLARGVVNLALAVTRTPPAPRALLVLGGLVDLVLGVLFTANPGRAAVGIALTIGLVAILWGVVFIATGLAARREVRDLEQREETTGSDDDSVASGQAPHPGASVPPQAAPAETETGQETPGRTGW
jgi:uncharacterized membrane protein HdeD (DUF308 family)